MKEKSFIVITFFNAFQQQKTSCPLQYRSWEGFVQYKFRDLKAEIREKQVKLLISNTYMK